MDAEAIRRLVDSVRWVYAKTYPHAPHEYTLFEWEIAKLPEFRMFANHISDHGGWEPFFNTKTWYFHFGDMKYWIMSDPNDCTLINRTFIDDSIVNRIEKYVSSQEFRFSKGMCLTDILNLSQYS